MFKCLGILLLVLVGIKMVRAIPDCLEPDTRVVSRWKNGNYYKGVVESLTNAINVLFDNGNRMSYNLHSKYDVIEDRIPEQNQIKWGDAVVVHRPHSFAFQPANIREIVGGRYMVWYKDGSYIYQTKNDIRVFNKTAVCNEPAYLGCFRDQVPRYLTVYIPTRPATISACVDMCNAQGYSIAALRNSDLCFCGNAYNKGYQTRDRRCDMPCYDNPYEKCGGVDSFSQYWTGIVGDKPSYRPAGLQAYTKFHMDPYGFQRTYQSVITKHSIPRFGKLPWKLIMQARRQAKKPISLAFSSPWRWNSLTSAWVRADGKQFRWTRQPAAGSNKNYRKWSSSKPLPRNGWTWDGKAWVPVVRTSTPVPQVSHPFSKEARLLSQSVYSKTGSENVYYSKNYQQTTAKPMAVSDLHRYNFWTVPKSTNANTIKSHSGLDISKNFTPDLVLQKLADRMKTVKWSQLSNFDQAFKPSSSIPITFRYLGCFADDYQRDLPFQYSLPVSSLTVRSCVLKCRENSFSVAGIQASSQCFCGNTYSKYGRVREEECAMRCRASVSDICGGVLRNSIYFTGIGSAWPNAKATVSTPSKTKANNQSSTHVQTKAKSKPTRKVTTKHEDKATVKADSKLGSRDEHRRPVNGRQKPRKRKNKARNKIADAPEQLPEKDKSGIEDFQVESIKVKVNFSELKKALETLSPEIVRRVQEDLSKMDQMKGKENTDYTRKNVNVQLEETKKDNREDYDEQDLERIRSELHNKALNRLTNENMKEIFRIMKIPKTELKMGKNDKNFKDAVKSIRVAKKKGMGRNGIKTTVNEKDIAHEEIESYSRISLDFPLKPTKRAGKAFERKPFWVSVNKQKKKQKSKLRGNIIMENRNDRTEKSRKAKINGRNVNEHSKKTSDNKREKKINDAARNAKTNKTEADSLNGNTKAKYVVGNKVQKLTKQNDMTHKERPRKIDSGNSGMNVASKDTKMDLQTHTSTKKVRLSKVIIKPVEPKGRKKTDTEANNVIRKAIKKVSKMDVQTRLSSRRIPDSANSVSSSNEITTSTKEKEKDNSGAVQIGYGNSPGKEDKISHKENNSLTDIKPGNDEVGDKVKKSKSKRKDKASKNSVLYLGNARKLNGKSQQKDEKSQRLTPDEKGNIQLDAQKEGDENGVIYLGAAAKQLLKSKKKENTKDEKNSLVSPKEVKAVKLDKEATNGKKLADGSGKIEGTDVRNKKKDTFVKEDTEPSAEMNKHSQASASQLVETQNDVASSGASAEASGVSATETKTPSEQENKLLSFQKQSTQRFNYDSKLNSSDLDKSVGSFHNANDVERKDKDGSTFDFSGISEADKATESKIILKLNTLLNSGSGDDNFEDVVKELETNKIDGIFTSENGKSNSTKKISESTPRKDDEYASKDGQNTSGSYLSGRKTVRLGEDLDENKQGKSIGEDQDGNTASTASVSLDQNSRNLPTKLMTVNKPQKIHSGSGSEVSDSDNVNSKYTYFGMGRNKDTLPLIRSDDLERLTQINKGNSLENSGEESPKTLLRDKDNSKKGKAMLNPKKTYHRLFAKSSIPTAPVYKMILIPKSTLAKTPQSGKKLKTKSKELKKSTSNGKIKDRSKVKGIRVVKNGVSFTISKAHNLETEKKKIGKLEDSSRAKSSAESKITNHAEKTKLKVHYISERRKKSPKKANSEKLKKKKKKMNAKDDDILDDAQHNLKDNGSRNQLIWRGNRLDEHNRNLED